MSRYWDSAKDEPEIARIIRDCAFVAVALITAVMGGGPQYNVWEQGLVGQAALRRAEQDRQIAIQEAHAKKESATLLAEATPNSSAPAKQ